jgi:hypothetical protein
VINVNRDVEVASAIVTFLTSQVFLISAFLCDEVLFRDREVI